MQRGRDVSFLATALSFGAIFFFIVAIVNAHQLAGQFVDNLDRAVTIGLWVVEAILAGLGFAFCMAVITKRMSSAK